MNTSLRKIERHSNFLINTGLPLNVLPLSYIFTGSRAGKFNRDDSDYNYIGVHLADTLEILQHPRFRDNQIGYIAKSYNRFHEKSNVYNQEFTLASFELWNFIDLYERGDIRVYEILFMEEIHSNPGWNEVTNILRSGLSSQSSYNVINIINQWHRKKHKDLKEILKIYYRTMQAIQFIKEDEFEWDIKKLQDTYKLPELDGLLERYTEYTRTKTCIMGQKELHWPTIEINQLKQELIKILEKKKLSNRPPKEVIKRVLSYFLNMRSSLI